MPKNSETVKTEKPDTGYETHCEEIPTKDLSVVRKGLKNG